MNLLPNKEHDEKVKRLSGQSNRHLLYAILLCICGFLANKIPYTADWQLYVIDCSLTLLCFVNLGIGLKVNEQLREERGKMY